MAPWHSGIGARFRHDPRKNGVAEKALVLVELASVDVRLAGVAGGVDQELGLLAQEGTAEDFAIGVIEFRPAEVAKGDALADTSKSRSSSP
jgi:hypothetical protein